MFLGIGHCLYVLSQSCYLVTLVDFLTIEMGESNLTFAISVFVVLGQLGTNIEIFNFIGICPQKLRCPRLVCLFNVVSIIGWWVFIAALWVFHFWRLVRWNCWQVNNGCTLFLFMR